VAKLTKLAKRYWCATALKKGVEMSGRDDHRVRSREIWRESILLLADQIVE
jgi:hypothetical protein